MILRKLLLHHKPTLYLKLVFHAFCQFFSFFCNGLILSNFILIYATIECLCLFFILNSEVFYILFELLEFILDNIRNESVFLPIYDKSVQLFSSDGNFLFKY
jgi:hypothetical protein